MLLSIIIVNYNVKYFLEQCLYSVIKASKNIETEIFVVDNDSTDGSREWLEPKFPSVIFKWGQQNIGFAKANNSALSEAKGSVILFLNPDTILPEDCFVKCLGFFKKNLNCGALGVEMIDGSGNFLKESKRSFPSPTASFFKMAGLAKMFPHSKLFSKYYAGHLSEDVIGETDVLAGAFFMIDRKVLNIAGSFDERFFMYGEDIDLSYRIQKAGFKNYYYPDTTIIHFKGESTSKKSRLYIQRFYGAMQLFVKKHYNRKKGTGFLMGLAIECKKILSLITLFLKSAFAGGGQRRAGDYETLVVARQADFNEMIQLIKYATDPLIIQGRISVDENDREASMGHIDDLQELILKNKTAKIIFCEEPLGFGDMIGLTKQLKGKADFLFHSRGSGSIVGSSSKNDNGLFIAK